MGLRDEAAPSDSWRYRPHMRGSLDLTNLGEIELPRSQAVIGNANEKNGTVSFVRQITSGFFEPTRVPLLDPDCTDVT
jgi:hypothetical protein